MSATATPPPATKRVRLGTWAGLATRYSIYRSEHAIDIDERDNFEVQRRRVFFDDVLLITYHRQLTLGPVIMIAIVLLLFWGLALFLYFLEQKPAAEVLALLPSPLFVLLVLQLILKTDVITVFGRRTKATLRYGFRKRFARATYEDLVVRTRAAQARLAEEIAAETPAVEEEEMPEMPPDFDAPAEGAPFDVAPPAGDVRAADVPATAPPHAGGEPVD